MKSHFDSEFFRGNRERLRAAFKGSAPIVLTAHGLMQRSSDTSFAFQQDNNFWYLTGIEDPDVILVMDRAKEYLIMPGRDDIRIAFEGQTTAEELAKISGIETVVDTKNGWRMLEKKLKKVKHAATTLPPPAFIDFYGIYTNPARAALVERIRSINSEIELLDLRPYLGELRMVKQKPELMAIQAAVQLTAKTLRNISRRLPAFGHEYEVEAAITGSFRKKNAHHGYEPIIASGLNATTLHYTRNDSPIKSGDWLLVDVGAKVDHYSADITRTFAPAKPTKRQQSVYAAVVAVQDFAFGLLRPGVVMKEYEQEIEKFMGEKLRELGLIRTIEHDSVRQYFTHSTSHFLGLDIHDIADYTKPLAPGMVLTVEPGIYIPQENLGIRIEDNAVITNKGLKVLSSGLSREAAYPTIS